MTTMAEAAMIDLIHGEIAAVLGTDPSTLDAATRFAEDLQADSLDLVEIVERVEAELRGRGIEITLPDEDVAGLATVGDARARFLALVDTAPPSTPASSQRGETT